MNATGSDPLQMVWSAIIVPPLTLLTVTLTELVISVHVTPLSNDVTERIYHISCVRAPGAYVSLVAPEILR